MTIPRWMAKLAPLNFGPLLFFLHCTVPVHAQEPPASQIQPQDPEKKESTQEKTAAPGVPQPPLAASHRFFYKENKWLFAGVAMARSLDFASTKNFRARGRDEILLTNEVVDNTPAFVAVQIGGVATSVGLSYLFHRTAHHKLERWVSILHIGVTSFGATRNFMLKSGHAPSATP